LRRFVSLGRSASTGSNNRGPKWEDGDGTTNTKRHVGKKWLIRGKMVRKGEMGKYSSKKKCQGKLARKLRTGTLAHKEVMPQRIGQKRIGPKKRNSFWGKVFQGERPGRGWWVAMACDGVQDVLKRTCPAQKKGGLSRGGTKLGDIADDRN